MVVKRSAPGKVILCGEHSVVYGRPAVAVPVSALRAYAEVKAGASNQGLIIHAVDLDQTVTLRESSKNHPLIKTAQAVLTHLNLSEPDATITLKSNLPIASGMGSGAAVTVAIARALSAYLGSELPEETISAMTYEIEKIHHGTPSGIDNTVITWEKPVYFIKEQPPEIFDIQQPFHLLIANSGIPSSTREAVNEVRRQWASAPEFYNLVFDCMGAIARAARVATEKGGDQVLGTLLNENHKLLTKIGVSLPELDQLIYAALEAGALGAKLTGSGQGGNIIALVEPETRTRVQHALLEAGAIKIWHTQVGGRDE